ncbi:MAG: PRC-barrel domain-containing protein [Desulfosarcina sp.]|nr:PRC-barrel domain-containing protein [Desulfobacterales bacterium]
MKYPLKAVVHCTDGRIGHLNYVIVDTRKEKVSHVVVKDHKSHNKKYLVPSRWIKDTTSELILLDRTKSDIRALDLFEENDFAQVMVRGYAVDPKITELWPHMVEAKKIYAARRRQVPVGETAVSLHARVHATDGRIGEVYEFIVEPSTWQITHLIVRKGRPWNKNQVSIPVTAIERIEEDRILLNINKADVKKLPATPVER